MAIIVYLIHYIYPQGKCLELNKTKLTGKFKQTHCNLLSNVNEINYSNAPLANPKFSSLKIYCNLIQSKRSYKQSSQFT